MAKAHGFTEDGARQIVETVRKVKPYPDDLTKRLPPSRTITTPILSTIAFAQEDIPAGQTGTFKFAKGMPGDEEEGAQEIEVCNSSDQMVVSGAKCVLSWLMVEQSGGSGWHVSHRLSATTILGKTDATLAKMASGTISVYSDTSTDTTNNIEAINLFADLGADKWVVAALIGNLWYLIAGDCA